MKKIIEKYDSSIVVEIDGKQYNKNDFGWLISTACYRKYLRTTIDLAIKMDGKTIFRFHDSPDNLIADETQIDFLKKLREMEIVKYAKVTLYYEEPGNFLQRILWKLYHDESNSFLKGIVSLWWCPKPTKVEIIKG